MHTNRNGHHSDDEQFDHHGNDRKFHRPPRSTTASYGTKRKDPQDRHTSQPRQGHRGQPPQRSSAPNAPHSRPNNEAAHVPGSQTVQNAAEDWRENWTKDENLPLARHVSGVESYLEDIDPDSVTVQIKYARHIDPNQFHRNKVLSEAVRIWFPAPRRRTF